MTPAEEFAAHILEIDKKLEGKILEIVSSLPNEEEEVDAFESLF